jgi:hypothetical protein
LINLSITSEKPKKTKTKNIPAIRFASQGKEKEKIPCKTPIMK